MGQRVRFADAIEELADMQGMTVDEAKATGSSRARPLTLSVCFRAQLRGVIDKKFFIFRLIMIFG
jgi:hypothetical protein